MSLLDRLCLAIATGFHLSYIPWRLLKDTSLVGKRRWSGAGLVGTALGWAALYALPEGPWFWPVLAAGIGAACWIAGRADRALGGHDDPRIVIDETVGFWAAAAGLPRGFAPLAAAFVLFRIFDATKPPPCRRLEALPGGAGVVMDDVMAGVYANLATRLLTATGLIG
ncbi:MAG: phosphatidylglycerophosphatase A [Elusimicrobia bacterium]|nr:phosphatidylglycerophosphatase A [Elusimicrobiota bacterium]